MDVQPSQAANRGARRTGFTGEVWIDPITAVHVPHQLSLGNVRFTPGARTAWHSHSIAQTLYVTEGKGSSRPAARRPPGFASGKWLTSPAVSGTGSAPHPTTL